MAAPLDGNTVKVVIPIVWCSIGRITAHGTTFSVCPAGIGPTRYFAYPTTEDDMRKLRIGKTANDPTESKAC